MALRAATVQVWHQILGSRATEWGRVCQKLDPRAKFFGEDYSDFAPFLNMSPYVRNLYASQGRVRNFVHQLFELENKGEVYGQNHQNDNYWKKTCCAFQVIDQRKFVFGGSVVWFMPPMQCVLRSALSCTLKYLTDIGGNDCSKDSGMAF